MGNFLTINSGKDYKHLDEGKVPVYGTGGYMLSVNESLSSVDAIGIGRKGTIDRPQYLKAPFWTVDTLFFLTTKNRFNLYYIYNLLQRIEWKQHDESTGVPSLSKNNVENIITNVSEDIDEQQAIANYFKSLDSLIQTTTKKIASLKQMKSACLVSMFPQEGETKPRVRFKGFEGEWNYVELSECLTVCKDRNFSEVYGKNDVLSVSDDYGVVNQIELLGRSYAGRSVANYRILKTGDVVYTKSPLKVKPFGIIKVNEKETGIVSTLYAVYSPKDGVCSRFISRYFEPAARMNRYIHPLVNKGAKNDMKVSDENVLKGKIFIPSDIKEQQKIASFFSTLDTQISLQEQRLEKLKQIKSACLDKMFV